jgi:hypothetical protein
MSHAGVTTAREAPRLRTVVDVQCPTAKGWTEAAAPSPECIPRLRGVLVESSKPLGRAHAAIGHAAAVRRNRHAEVAPCRLDALANTVARMVAIKLIGLVTVLMAGIGGVTAGALSVTVMTQAAAGRASAHLPGMLTLRGRL